MHIYLARVMLFSQIMKTCFSFFLSIFCLCCLSHGGTAGLVSDNADGISILGDVTCLPAPEGLVGWWSGDGSAQDSVSGNFGALQKGATYAPGLVGQAFSLTNGAFVEIPNSTNVNFSGNMPMTVELWAYRTGSGTTMHLVSKRNGALDAEYQIAFDPESGLGFASIKMPWQVTQAACGVSLPMNQWWHLAGTFDGSVMSFYTNGVLAATAVGTLGPANSQPLRIGSIDYGFGSAPFEGLLEEVSLYNRALTAQEIQSVYAAGSAGKCFTPTAPSIITQPQSQMIDAGSSVSFNVTATGSYPLHFQWQLGGVSLVSATNSTLILTNVQPVNAGAYAVVIVNDAGFAVSSNALLEVKTYPPYIWTGPQSQSVAAGSPASFAVYATGSFPLYYQWKFNDSLLLNETNATLKLASAQPANEGEYSVTVKNPYGSVTTTNVTLTVRTDPPVIITQPQNITVNAGDNVSWSVVAAGSTPLTYKWRFNGIDLAGEIKSTLTINGVERSNAGSYDVIVGNAYGSVTSSVVSLTVHQAPVITSQPQDKNVGAGTNVVFSVGVLGDAPLAYQWYFNGSPLNTATNDTLSLASAAQNQSGFYSVTVRNSYGTATSRNAALNVIGDCLNVPSGLVGWWTGEGNTEDTVSGSWGILKNGATYAPGKVGQAFSLTNGSYVEIPNSPALNYSGAKAMTAELWVYRTGLGSTMHILAKRIGTGDIDYQLSFDDNWGLTFASGSPQSLVLAISHTPLPLNTWIHLAGTSDGSYLKLYINGQLAATATGAMGPENNEPLRIGAIDYPQYSFEGLIDEVSLYNRALSPAEIQAIYAAGSAGKCFTPTAPSIEAQPQDQRVDTAASASFNVIATGSFPLSYQWQHNGFNLLNATNSVLNLTNVQSGDAGAYTVVIANDYGAITSSNAVLTVNPLPTTVQILNVDLADGKASVPINMISRGGENALGFSIQFNPSWLSFNGVSLGSGASGVTLVVNSNQVGSGELGLIFTLSPNAIFTAGTQQLAILSFDATPLPAAVTASLNFVNQPTVKQVVDQGGNVISATFINGSVNIPFRGYEGDIAPQPDGDGAVTVADWVRVGRLVASLDITTNASEFQRADCAPRSLLGDGVLSVADWVQAGRYAAGLDPLTGGGGPTLATNMTPAALHKEGLHAFSTATRSLAFSANPSKAGQSYEAAIELAAQGNENGLEFSVVFDPAVMTFTDGRTGAGAANANLNLNTNKSGAGQIGVLLALPTGTAFTAGTQEVLKLQFAMATNAVGHTPLSFTNIPLLQQAVDTTAENLTMYYQNTLIAVAPQNGDPMLKATASANGLTFTWPVWAGRYVLEASTNLMSNGWELVAMPAITNGNNVSVIFPISGTEAQKYFRLRYP